MNEQPGTDETDATKLALIIANMLLVAATILGWIVLWCAFGAVVLALLWRAVRDRG